MDHFFLGLFFFAVPLRLILVFFAFRFFAMKALMPLREPDSGQPNARGGLYQCSEMHNRGGGDDLVRHGLERCGLAENFPGPEEVVEQHWPMTGPMPPRRVRDAKGKRLGATLRERSHAA